MANWKEKLMLNDLYKKIDDTILSVNEAGKQVANRIRKLKYYKKYIDELEEIADNFEFDCEDVEDFDRNLEELYNFGDFNHRLWIQTF